MKAPFPATSVRARHERGVVLIISLMMLVIISLLATFSIRNSTSSEAVSGNVRTTQLAAQAAEIALRYCEDSVALFVRSTASGGTVTSLPNNGSATLQILDHQDPPRAVDTSVWDSATTATWVVPSTVFGTATAYKRYPECMVERVPVVTATGRYTTTTTYLVTARGFGPEVAADATRGRPDGSEVWLQSTIELE